MATKRSLPPSEENERKQTNQKVRAFLFPLRKQDELQPRSKQIELEKWEGLYRNKVAIEPPYDLETLNYIAENSSIITPCIDAMKTNIDSFRHHYVSRFENTEKEIPNKSKNKMADELVDLKNFFATCCFDYSFTELRTRTRTDLELTGNAFWEILRKSDGQVDGIRHIPSYSVRLGGLQRKAILVSRQFVVWNRKTKDFEFKKVTTIKRFRLFIQIKGTKKVFFKTFGDPQIYDARTGDSQKESEKKIQYRHQANEILHFKIYSGRTPYGIPRYIGNLFSIFGSRQAEEVNFTTLTNNQIPSMVLMVSNGMLTESSISRIKEFAEKKMARQKNFSQIMVLEAEPATEALGDPSSGNIKMDIKPLTDAQIQDAMFVNYDKANQGKIRRSWRLPPILIGDSESYNRATADTSLKFADEQIFNPERDAFDWIINNFILPELNVKYLKFKSNTPNVTNDEDLIKVMNVGERTGGLTPRIARMLIADIFGKDLGKIDSELLHPDIPFTLQIAERAKKEGPINQGTVAGINRPSLYQEGKSGGEDVQKFVDELYQLRDAIKERYKITDDEDF